MRPSALLKILFAGVLCASVFPSACQREATEGLRNRQSLSVEVKTDKLKFQAGELVKVEVLVRGEKSLTDIRVEAALFVPITGVENLELRPLESEEKHQAGYEGDLQLRADAADGFYGITVEAVLGSEKAVGKAAFLVGHAVGDFLIASAVPEENQEEDLQRYFSDFRGVGGTTVIIHNIITDKAWYPSRVCSRAARPGTPEDKVGAALALARKHGFSALLSVSWDMTRQMPYSDYAQSFDSVLGELWKLYGSDPAFLGFYDYQEGSGTYFASQVREFAAAAKRRNP
ncbi:MAG: hypothetical protein AB1715_07625, partial [Acidobacteriota bacterium]